VGRARGLDVSNPPLVLSGQLTPLFGWLAYFAVQAERLAEESVLTAGKTCGFESKVKYREGRDICQQTVSIPRGRDSVETG
jgi:hypothetical protein